MPESVFHGIFDTAFTSVIAPGSFLLCIGTALVLGVCFCAMAQWQDASGGSFAVTLALLPAAVCVVIMMVNGNVGTGVAVAGAFSLVRFRSIPGTGREICCIFIAMATGLMTGMGYLAYAALFTLIMGAAMMIGTLLMNPKQSPKNRILRITIPENLDYVGVFDPVLDTYAVEYTLKQVKTVNMGSLFRLTYDLTLQENAQEKALLDELRCLNGNLEISLSCQESAAPTM